MFLKENIFLDLFKIGFTFTVFLFLSKMRFLVSPENKIFLLFSFFGLFEKIFSFKMKTEIQPNTFLSPFSISSENDNRKQPNQTPLRNSSKIKETLKK